MIVCHSANDIVYLQSPWNYYLSTDKYGRLTCDNQEINEDCRFQLEYNRNGQWAFKSVTYGMYLGGDMDQLHCFTKTPEWWSPHLAFQPQVSSLSTPGAMLTMFASLDQFETRAS